MESLFRSAGVDDARVEWARARLAVAVRAELDALVELAAAETVHLPGYEELRVEDVKPNTRRGMEAIVATLAGGDWQDLGVVLRDVAYARASQGLQPRALFSLLDRTERQIGDIAARCMHGHDELVPAAIVARRICDAGREVIVEAFQRAHLEAREAVTRLARQLSAPVLPAVARILVADARGLPGATIHATLADALVAAHAQG